MAQKHMLLIDGGLALFDNPQLRQQRRKAPESCLSALGKMRRLPHNIEAEIAVLGAIIVDWRTWDRVSCNLKQEYFVLEEHGRIFRKCQFLIEQNRKCDAVTLSDFFKTDDLVSSAGGESYLIKLVECAATPSNAVAYSKVIYNTHLKRKLIDLGEEVINEAYDSSLSDAAEEQIEKIEESLFSLVDNDTDADFVPISSSIAPVFADARRALERRKLGLPNGVQTGFTELDSMIGGFEPGQLIIAAGRSSMGKTTFALNIAFNVATSYLSLNSKERKGHPIAGGKVAVISLETNGPSLVRQNLQSRITGIPGQRFRTGNVTEQEIEYAERICKEQLSPLPITVMDSIPTIAVIRSKLRRLKRKHGLGLVIVDYLQIIRSIGGKRENMYQKVTEISAGLKAIAKELNVPLIALSQLSRENERREDNRPKISDARDSGSIEENADLFFLLYREHYYLSRMKPKPEASWEEQADHDAKMRATEHKVEVIIGKNRNGPVGCVELYYDQATALMRDADRPM